MRRGRRTSQGIGGLLLIAALLWAGCGGRGGRGAEQSGSGGRSEPAVPTMPAAQFAQPTTMITVAPSDAVTETEPAEANSSEVASGEAVTESAGAGSVEAGTPEPAGAALTAEQARGQELYTTRKCAECHGANAEGVPDKGSALAGTTLTEQEFTDLLRTGGDIGPDHLFGPMTISPSGVTAIHVWLQALPAE